MQATARKGIVPVDIWSDVFKQIPRLDPWTLSKCMLVSTSWLKAAGEVWLQRHFSCALATKRLLKSLLLLTTLDTLKINRNVDIEISDFSHLTGLTSLEIQLTVECPLQHFPKLTQFTMVWEGGTAYPYRGDVTLEGLENLTNLTSLSVPYHLANEDALHQLTNLTQLNYPFEFTSPNLTKLETVPTPPPSDPDQAAPEPDPATRTEIQRLIDSPADIDLVQTMGNLRVVKLCCLNSSTYDIDSQKFFDALPNLTQVELSCGLNLVGLEELKNPLPLIDDFFLFVRADIPSPAALSKVFPNLKKLGLGLHWYNESQLEGEVHLPLLEKLTIYIRGLEGLEKILSIAQDFEKLTEISITYAFQNKDLLSGRDEAKERIEYYHSLLPSLQINFEKSRPGGH